MIKVKRLVLDILKPHQPNAVEFCGTLAALGNNYQVSLTVMEMDDKTATTQVEIKADSLDFEAIKKAIVQIGGSLHSIDIVEVKNEFDQ